MRCILGGCPDPLYKKFGNTLVKNRPKALIKYLSSPYFKKELHGRHGCVISKEELNTELKLVAHISDLRIRKEMQAFYDRVLQKIGKNKRLTIIWTPRDNEQNHFKEILLHEFIHELIDDNCLRPDSWKWNEGLVTYITRYALRTHKVFEKKPSLGKDKMTNIYMQYTHKWALLFKKTHNSLERRKCIENLLRSLKK
ncbi:hypothetical protein FJZ18_01200 [Candidatus Pacearchaeota archaeon]|nr:hypothetical protein [Candidatus Pacearchaeota archaeon]